MARAAHNGNLFPCLADLLALQPNMDIRLHIGADDTIDGGDLLPDFTAPVWSLFRWQR